jgi:large subunit ribosomal protein L15
LIKVLGTGDLKSAVTVRAHKFSKSAQEKIAAAGGKVEPIGGRERSRGPQQVQV